MPSRCLLRATLSLALAAPACSSDPAPINLPDAAVTDVDAAVSTCAAPTGPGTMHSVGPSTSEAWMAADGPHLVTAPLTIGADVTLTIAPCAVVRLAPGAGLLVEGDLVAQGTPTEPIVLERADAQRAWGTIETRPGAQVRLAYATLDGGGAAGPVLDIRGDQAAAPQPILGVSSVAVRGASAIGVVLREGAGFAPASSDLTITGAGSFPLSTWARAAGGLPTGSYAGNGADAILLPALGGLDDIQEDTTLADLGVPYRVGAPGATSAVLRVKGAGGPRLTLQAGVTLQFADGARLVVDGTTPGSVAGLVAAGTSAAPVTFTSASATPTAGSWVGLVFTGMVDPTNAITHARIAYAGGDSQISSYDCPSPANPGFSNNGAVVIAGGEPASAFVTSTVIEASAGDGVVRGWTGGVVDFLPTNTFTTVARCHQTYPRPASGACPDPAPCPQ